MSKCTFSTVHLDGRRTYFHLAWSKHVTKQQLSNWGVVPQRYLEGGVPFLPLPSSAVPGPSPEPLSPHPSVANLGRGESSRSGGGAGVRGVRGRAEGLGWAAERAPPGGGEDALSLRRAQARGTAGRSPWSRAVGAETTCTAPARTAPPPPPLLRGSSPPLPTLQRRWYIPADS